MKPAAKAKAKLKAKNGAASTKASISSAATDASPRPSIGSAATAASSKKKNKVVKKNLAPPEDPNGEEPQDQNVPQPAGTQPGKQKVPLKKKLPASQAFPRASVISKAGTKKTLKKAGGVDSISSSLTSIRTGPPIRGSTVSLFKGKGKGKGSLQSQTGKKRGILGAAKAKVGKLLGKGKKKGQGGEGWYGKENHNLAFGIVGGIILLVLIIIIVAVVLSGGGGGNNGTTIGSLPNSTTTIPQTMTSRGTGTSRLPTTTPTTTTTTTTTTTPTTTRTTTTNTSPATTPCSFLPGPDPSKPEQTGVYCRNCFGESGCKVCCEKYFSRGSSGRFHCIIACQNGEYNVQPQDAIL